MKLSELEPVWCKTASPTSFWRLDNPQGAEGLLILCPCLEGHYLMVWFANPIGGGPPAAPGWLPAPRWQRSGETFETLTLTPSVNASCWHGWIQNGEARRC